MEITRQSEAQATLSAPGYDSKGVEKGRSIGLMYHKYRQIKSEIQFPLSSKAKGVNHPKWQK